MEAEKWEREEEKEMHLQVLVGPVLIKYIFDDFAED